MLIFSLRPQVVDQGGFFTDAVDDFFIFIVLERRIFIADADIHEWYPFDTVSPVLSSDRL